MVDGSKYKGQFLKGGTIKDGIGQMIYPDGSLFEGLFKDDDTVKGRYIFTNGTVYTGKMKNHKMHGKGVLKFGKKVVYKGRFINGEKCDKLKSLPTKLNKNLNATEEDATPPAKSVQWDFNKW
mmetsp:Transcript_33778/g.33273  ORF Transcript_33778/g.33273 Transcript_33778/m.33273 type:complete len:123 (-) Transcript_33778:60-428(-)